MTFKFKPRVQVPAQFELSATPYIGKELWKEGLEMMHHWMAEYFEVGDVFADYVFAQELKVHRCIADIWLFGLRSTGHIEAMSIVKGNNTEIFAPGFVILPITKRVIDLKVPQELIDFDPWEDRTLDKDIPDAVYADYYIDKYFDIFINEYYFYTGRMRKRPNGKTFAPIEQGEHPRHAHPAKTRISIAPPPIEWRETLDIFCEL